MAGRVMEGDRERWNANWRERAGELETHAPFLAEHAHLLPNRGKALDVAAGAGRNAIWLARRGLDVTLLDISDVALEKAERRATAAGLAKRMRFLRVDLDDELGLAPLFDLVLICDFLQRARRDAFTGLLHEGGVLIAVQPTVQNLERHARPGRQYLVDPGELEQWSRDLGMDVLVASEGWSHEGRHDALVIARRGTAVVAAEPESAESGPCEGPYR